MSEITNYVLFVSGETDEFRLNNLLNPLIAQGQLGRPWAGGFKEISRVAGGYKVMYPPVYGYCANGFGPDEMLPLMLKVKWAEPKLIRLAVLDHHDAIEPMPWRVLSLEEIKALAGRKWRDIRHEEYEKHGPYRT